MDLHFFKNQNWGTSILEFHSMNEESFFSIHHQKPFLLKNYAQSWNLLKKCTPSFFKSSVPDLELDILKLSDRSFHKMKIKNFFENFYEKNNSEFYLVDWTFEENLPELLKDYEVPNFFHSWFEDFQNVQKPKLRWFYIGAKGTKSALHLDIVDTSAWNVILSGCKIWIFFPPSDFEFLYDLKVDAFYPDYEKFPLLKKTHPYTCVQYPGDLVFTPSGWAHQVINWEGGISITENFVNQSNIDSVLRRLEQEKMKEIYHELLKIKG